MPSSTEASAQTENEIKQVIQQRLDAVGRGDEKAYSTFFAKECVVTSDNGALVRPDDIATEWATNFSSGISAKNSGPLDLKVNSYGDIVVASFRTELDSDWSGQRVFESSRFTDVFARREGRWLLVSHQETAMPNARRLAAKVNPAVYDAYVGEYQLTPKYIVKVKRDGDKLMDLWPGDKDFAEDVPVSDNEFFARGDAGQVIYMKDKAGKVTHFILRTGGGDLIAKKIK